MALLDHRRAGVLLHPTSLPGPYKGGDIGSAAYQFIDFLASSGCSIWQMLPLGPTHSDGSPYQCLSVHAGNSLLVSLDWLVEKGWLNFSTIHEPVDSTSFRLKCLRSAYQSFTEQDNVEWNSKLNAFIEQQSSWLNDYALFLAIKDSQDGIPWNEWPADLAARDPAALKKAGELFADYIARVKFEQFIFFSQWNEMRDYARTQGVYLFGDMPIFVSYDSADVWACRENFLLDDKGIASFVAGVPPDAFSDEGQRWGNPLYDWDFMQSDNFSWWIDRFKTQTELFDIIRIDHFRGFESCWHIAADEETAINGTWVKNPGDALLKVLFNSLDSLSLVAEDLGLITDEVIALRDKFSLPGMKILQFAFDSDSRNLYLPHNHDKNSVVYTGTHDNDTTLGWYLNLGASSKTHLYEYLGVPEHRNLDMPWIMNRMALASVANLAILPMQDLLSLDSSHRMNIPGTTEDNWQWRFEWNQLWPGLSSDLRKLVEIYDRCSHEYQDL